MTPKPHDLSDLYLAPVVLGVDARIEELGHLDKDALVYEVALESDKPDYSRALREEALIRTVTHLIDCHGWEFRWDPRGLRLTHNAHTFVLGIPAGLVEYLEGSPRASVQPLCPDRRALRWNGSRWSEPARVDAPGFAGVPCFTGAFVAVDSQER